MCPFSPFSEEYLQTKSEINNLVYKKLRSFYDACSEYATRLALADAGDGIEDANFLKENHPIQKSGCLFCKGNGCHLIKFNFRPGSSTLALPMSRLGRLCSGRRSSARASGFFPESGLSKSASWPAFTG